MHVEYILEEDGTQVAFTRVWQDDHNRFFGIFRTDGVAYRRGYRGAARDPGNNTLITRKAASIAYRIFIADLLNVIYQGQIQILGYKACSNSRYFMRPGF